MSSFACIDIQELPDLRYYRWDSVEVWCYGDGHCYFSAGGPADVFDFHSLAKPVKYLLLLCMAVFLVPGLMWPVQRLFMKRETAPLAKPQD